MFGRRKILICPLLVAALGFGLSGCGWLEPPYEIRVPAPPDDLSAEELLPLAEPMTDVAAFPFSALIRDAAADWAFREYEGEVTFGAIRFKSLEAAAEAMDQIHDSHEARRSSKVSVNDYSWAEAVGPGYRFVWKNGDCLFLVESPSRSKAEPILLLSDYVSEVKTEQ